MRVGCALFCVAAVWLTACGGSVAQSDPDIQLHPSEVTGLPVLWLGESYDEDGDGTGDLPLTGASFHSSPELRNPRDGSLIRPQVSFYSMAYGSCSVPEGDEGGCPVPITVVIESPCYAQPLAEGLVYAAVPVRGVEAHFFAEGGLRIDTAEFTVSVYAVEETKEKTEQRLVAVAEHLSGANAEASSYDMESVFQSIGDNVPRSESCD
jgi:hypothetical protein